ncbi:tripartite tricarboxylate transporter substrate binding protein [Reyranella sp.]|uniref:Bug family tripartite tricarboxylate transporter substrate binding protein n=1 Tax=Reyranella sp. TaxID=1929291 RepID=UPI0025F96108|nr:tripartite tricarboxylate transporter substrate binding protein [Reyranella sp.]
MRRRTLIVSSTAVLAAPFAARAQAWPSQPVRLVVAFPPGGPTDVYGRLFGERLGRALGQPVVVDNKAGAAGVIGTLGVARSKPDGYTLVFGTASTQTLYPSMTAKPDYDVLKDFAYIAHVGGGPAAFVGGLAQPDTLKGLLDAARAKPGTLSYGSPGSGTLLHLTTERLKAAAGGVQITHVPYRGSGPAMNDLLSGQIAMMATTLGSALPLHRSGKARMLAVATASRPMLAPEVPTVSETLGGVPFEAVLWHCLAGPAGLSPEVVARLAAATRETMNDPALLKALAEQGIVPVIDSTPDSTLAYVRAETERWAPIVKAAGIKLE